MLSALVGVLPVLGGPLKTTLVIVQAVVDFIV